MQDSFNVDVLRRCCFSPVRTRSARAREKEKIHERELREREKTRENLRREREKERKSKRGGKRKERRTIVNFPSFSLPAIFVLQLSSVS